VPIINIVGGTEVGGCNFTGTVIHPLQARQLRRRRHRAWARHRRRQPAGRCRAARSASWCCATPNIGLTKQPVARRRALPRQLLAHAAGPSGCMATSRQDEDGLFYIVGRSDDTLKVSGKRTGPSEIEAC
jgi:acetyl-CoA synthetase